MKIKIKKIQLNIQYIRDQNLTGQQLILDNINITNYFIQLLDVQNLGIERIQLLFVIPIMKNQVNWLAIFLTLLIPSSFMYNFDWPQYLSTALQDSPYSYSLKQVKLYYTIPQLITLMLCFKVGMIFDRMKLQKLLFFVPTFILISHTLIAITFIASFAGTYYLTIFFRGIFVLMGQSTFILQAMILLKLLDENASLILGFGTIIPAMFDLLNSQVTPLIFNSSKQISVSLFIGSGVCLLILIISIYLKFKINEKKQIKTQSPPVAEAAAGVQQNKNKTIFDQIKSFSLPFWLLQLQIFIMYILTYVFVSIAFDLIVTRFQIQYTRGKQIIMIPLFTSAISSFLWLYLIKNFPSYRRIFFVVISFFAFIAHTALYFLPNSDSGDNSIQFINIIVVLIFIGISTSGLLLEIGTIYLVSKKQQTGAAFSFVTIALSLAYVIVPSIVDFISEQSGYRCTSFVFIGFSILSLILSCYVKLKDKKFMIYDKKGEQQNKVQTLKTDQVIITMPEDNSIRQISPSNN